MKYLFVVFSLFLFQHLDCQDYYSDRLFMKIREPYSSNFNKEKFLENLKSNEKIKIFERAFQSEEMFSVYHIILKKEDSIVVSELISELSKKEEVEIAERIPVYRLFFTPNDPQYSSQWNLAKIQADLAWNISQGCSGIKVAVTDDGFLLTHQDLIAQWYINPGEIAGNGIDDDGNGYIDDWRGWDAANNDNDPSAFNPTNSYFTHGTHVAGIVGATTNNSTGIASIGFQNKIIPVKIGRDVDGALTGPYQGLDYAINATSCDVINMSWGGGGKSMIYQMLFDIAYTKNIVCVAASGNSNSPTPMYPASYNHVISVASSTNTDAKSSFSNFGTSVDVTAPGSGILSCLAGSTSSYGNLSGTSMASPLVAGLCGLMKCYNPRPVDSIEACLKRSCDNVNAQNPGYIGQLGAGRINAYQALQCLTSKPKSAFIALDTFQCVNQSVGYQAQSYGIPTLTYQWSFPGGSPATSTAPNPTITYSTNGYKSAMLITCNSLGCDTITKINLVHIDTPRAVLKTETINLVGQVHSVYLSINFTGNPPYTIGINNGSTTIVKTSIVQNPYFVQMPISKDTTIFTLTSYSDKSCTGNFSGKSIVYRKTPKNDTTICVTLRTSDLGAIDGFGSSSTSSTSISWTFSHDENVVANWTLSGSPYFWRAILKYNLSGIPSNSTIQSAKLNLYSKPNAVHGWTGQPTAGTSNSTSIQRITNSWTTSTISTSSWPSTSSSNEVILAQSPTTNYSYQNVDVKNLVNDLIQNGNNGLFLRHVNTPYYNSLIFYSGDDANISNHPQLQICYTIPGTNGPPITTDCDTSQLNNGLVLNLPFNGNTNDISGNNNHATNFGANLVADRKGLANKAYSFDGSSSRMVIPNFPTSPTNNLSISLWFKSNTSTQQAYAGLIDHSHTVSASSLQNWVIEHNNTANQVFLGWRINSTQWSNLAFVSAPYDYTKWNHLVAIKSGDTLTYYLNCIKISSTIEPNSAAILKNIANLNIGCVQSSSPIRFFNGAIDDIRVYHRVLNEKEVLALGECCTTVVTSDCDTSQLNNGLVLNLPFNGNTNDVSGNNNHATNYGATPVAGKSGVANTAYQFNGTSNFMQVSHNSSLALNSAFSVTCKMKIDGFNSAPCRGNMIFFKGHSVNVTGNQHFDWVYAPNAYTGSCSAPLDTLHQNLFPGSLTMPSPTAYSNYLQRFKWYCFAVVQKNDTLYNYIDGVMVYKTPNIGTGSNPYDIFIGKSNYPSYPFFLNATIDELRVYNRSLSPAEVKGYCGTCQITAPPVIVDCDTSQLNNGLVLNLPFNGNTNDVSGNNNHATNYGATLVAGKSGVANTAYRFDGTSNYMKVTNSSSLTPTNITMCAILKPKGFYSGACMGNAIIDKGNSDGIVGKYMLRYSPLNNSGLCTGQNINQNNFYAGVSTSGCSASNIYNSPYVKQDSWYCVVSTYNGDSLKTFVNGILRHSCKPNIPIGSNMDDLFIGKVNSAAYPYWLNAEVDDIRIYNRVIAPAEVKGYCGTCQVVPPPPVKCDTSKKLTYTQCTSDSIQVILRPGSSYQWSPKIGLSNDTIPNPKIYVNAYQTYLVIYRDSNGCQLIDTVIINVKKSALYPKLPDYLICINDSTPLISIPIYATNISWSPNQYISNPNSKSVYLYPPANKTYYLSFIDTFGCTIRDTIVVNVNPNCCQARARFDLSDSILCFGNVLNITNKSKGTGSILYGWNFGTAIPASFAGKNPPAIQFSQGGMYTIRLIVDNGICKDTMIKSVYINQFKPFAGTDTSSCQINIIKQLGEDPVSTWKYTWTPTTYLSDPNIANPICNLVNDSIQYILKAKDLESGCEFSDTVVVKTNTSIPTVTTYTYKCNGDSIFFNGNWYKSTGNFFKTIKKADGLCDSLAEVLRAYFTVPTSKTYAPKIYCKKYIDSKGNTHTVDYHQIDTTRNSRGCDSIYHDYPILIVNPTYKSQTISACDSVLYKGKKYFKNTNNIDSTIVKGKLSGCDSLVTLIHIQIHPKPIAYIVASKPNPVSYNDTVVLTASGGVLYLWNTMSTLNPIYHTVKDEKLHLYTVTVTNSNGCKDTATYTIKGIIEDCDYGVPSAFTPNGDNVNDVIIPNINKCAKILEFAIYDRVGEKMFETSKDHDGWDGNFRGKPAPMAVYVYYIRLMTPFGIRIHHGSITLVR